MNLSFRRAGAAALWIVLLAGPGFSQTQVDLRTQSRNVDFTGAISTRPVKTGSVLPAVCTTGELFFNTAAAAGSNLYLCASTNSWNQVSGGGGTGSASAVATSTISGLPATCVIGEIRYVTDASFAAGGWRLFQCTSTNVWTQLGVQADGTGYLTVTCTTPGTCLVGANTAVLPSLPGPNAWTGSNNFSTASKTAPFRLASSPPSTCDATAREFYFDTVQNTLNACTSSNVWTPFGSSHGSLLLYQSANGTTVAGNGSTQTLASYVIPAGTLRVGDVVEIEANFARTGTAGPISFGMTFGGTALPSCCVSTATTSAAAVYRASLVVTGTAAETWGGTLFSDGVASPASPFTSAVSASIAAPITVALTQNGTGPDTGAVTSWFIKVTR